MAQNATFLKSLNMSMKQKGLALGVASIQLVPYDAVNRNKVSIRQLPLFYFSFLLTTCFDPYGPSSGEIYN
jgi:hypothetical protein